MPILDFEYDDVSQRLTKTLQDFGFDHLFKVQYFENHLGMTEGLDFGLMFSINAPRLSNLDELEDKVQGFLEQLRSGLEGSEMVLSLTKDLSDQVEELTVKNENLETEIERLKEFETHHKLEMELRHGNQK